MLFRVFDLSGGVAIAVVISLIMIAPANAGGGCTPQLEKLKASLMELPESAAKEKAMGHYNAAINAEGDYDEEGCLEQLKAALEAVENEATATSN